MTSAEVVYPAGHTRWGRFAVTFLAAMVAVAAVASSLIGGVVAANVSLGGIPMKLKVAELQGNGLGMFGNAATASNGNKQVATAGIGDATIKGGLCAAVEVPVPILGGFTILLNAPADRQVTAKSLVLDLTQLKSDMQATNLVIGRDSSTLNRGGVTGPAGSNGIQSDLVTLSNVDGTAYALSAGSLRVDSIAIDVARRGAGC